MNYDTDKVDEMVLALLHLTSFEEPQGIRAWKGHDWNTLNRLHKKGFISDPKGTTKSVVLTKDGAKRSGELFKKFFCKD